MSQVRIIEIDIFLHKWIDATGDGDDDNDNDDDDNKNYNNNNKTTQKYLHQ